MGENLFNSEHKATSDKYREGYERTFKMEVPVCLVDESGEISQEAWDGIGKNYTREE